MWISYESPVFASLLLALPLFGLLFVCLARYRRRSLKEFFNDRGVDASVGLLRSNLSSGLRGLFFLLAYALSVLALMDPVLQLDSERPTSSSTQQSAKVRRKVHDVVFLLDVSASMGVKDGRLSRSRLDYGKEIIDEIVDRLRGETASLFIFTSETTQIVPGTMDYLYLRQLLREVDVNGNGATGTDLGGTLKVIYEQYWARPEQRRLSALILSDGGDTTLEGLAGSERQKAIAQITKTLQLHGTVDTIGLGTLSGGEVPGVNQKVHSALVEDVLEAISAAGRGQYFSAANLSSTELAERIVANLQREHASFGGVHEQVLMAGNVLGTEITRHSLFQLFLGLAMLFLAVGLLWPVGILVLVLIWAFLPLGLQADNAALETFSRRALLYVQADKLERAQSIYQKLLTDDLALWQKNILRYDLGTLALQQQQWLQATEWFAKVESADQMSPEFTARWRFNRALAMYGAAAADAALDEDERTVLLEQALALTTGDAQPTMRSLRIAIKRSLTKLQTKQTEQFLVQNSPLQALGVVWAWAIDLRDQLHLLPPEASAVDIGNLLRSYGEKGEKLTSPKQVKDLVERLLGALNEEALPSIRAPLASLIAELEKGLKSVEGGLQELQCALVKAIAFRPVELSRVQKLSAQVEKSSSPYLALAQSSLTSALSAKDEQQRALYAQQALFWLQEAIRGNLAVDAKAILERAVRLENRAWQFARALGEGSEWQEARRTNQQQVLDVAATFIPQVLDQGQKNYASQKCQRFPWQGVLPLFFEGEHAAKRANQATLSLSSVIKEQKEAYRKWSKALEMLNKEEPQQQSSSDYSAAQRGLPKQIQDLSVQDALRLLQAMQEADRRKKEPVPLKQGPKPW